jgi:histone deacetylase complex regulatory component SIN3
MVVMWLQVAQLFHAHDDLLEEFTFFLPDSKAPHRGALTACTMHA